MCMWLPAYSVQINGITVNVVGQSDMAGHTDVRMYCCLSKRPEIDLLNGVERRCYGKGWI